MKLDRGTTDYLRAMSFDVVVEVVYRRTRRIRARNKLEAKEMAKDRDVDPTLSEWVEMKVKQTENAGELVLMPEELSLIKKLKPNGDS